MLFFGPKPIFCGHPQNVTIMMGHLKDNLFVLTALHVGLRGAVSALFGPKKQFFYATPIKPTFSGLRRIRLNGIITSPCPEVTLKPLVYQ